VNGDLVAFLRARLDEDEAWVSQWSERGGSHWQWMETRLLREVEAKRAILARYEQVAATWRDELHGGATAGTMGFVILRIAAVYSDHPDYRPEWKP
jgi:hypothetical protein